MRIGKPAVTSGSIGRSHFGCGSVSMSFPVMFGMILTLSAAGTSWLAPPDRQRLRKCADKGRTYEARRIQSGTACSLISFPAHGLLRLLVVGRHPAPISAAPNVAALNKPPVRDRARNGLRGHPDILRALELPVAR